MVHRVHISNIYGLDTVAILSINANHVTVFIRADYIKVREVIMGQFTDFFDIFERVRIKFLISFEAVFIVLSLWPLAASNDIQHYNDRVQKE